MRGVRLLDTYRDRNGDLWEVVGLCDEPQATVRKVATGETEEHVIGCRNWCDKFTNGPMRSAPRVADLVRAASDIVGEAERLMPGRDVDRLRMSLQALREQA